MTTAEALERLNDAAYELLAIRSLRELEVDCRAIIHSGMNAQQKTVPGPLDGFCRVPGVEPPLFVMVAATTTSPASLKAKWLAPLPANERKSATAKPKSSKTKPKKSKTPEDGDLTKAIQRAAELRKDNPTGSFVVYMATNRNLHLDLEAAARTMGQTAGLEVRFLEQSRLRDFLDMNPVGQWLRQEHLGIEADQISLPLLQKLSEANVFGYANDVAMFDDFAPTKTKSSALILQRLQNRSTYVHLLVGSSGVGKSVTALGVLRNQVANGGIGLWLSSETVENSLTLSDAIRAVLGALHPQLGRDAGTATLALGAGHGPILLVVDDINRSNAPLRAIKKLLSWLRPDSSETTGVRLAGRVKVLCPLWDSYWSSISSDAEMTSWIDVLHLTRFTRPETLALLMTAPRVFSDVESNRYADALEDDPILVGLFVRMLRVSSSSQPMELCLDAIGTFIRSSIRDLALVRGESDESYIAAIEGLARQMVIRRSFHPSWAELQDWFATNAFNLQRLDSLAAQGHICRFRETGTRRVLEFRHDRLLEFCIANALAEILHGFPTDWTLACDPYYVPYLGRCLARSEFGDDVLTCVAKESPAALIASLRFVPRPLNGYGRQLVDRAATWLSEARRNSAPMRHAVQLLREAETPFTLEVTESRKNDPPLWDARLRCGDAKAGALTLAHDFAPRSISHWFEQLLKEANEQHHDEIVAGIVEILNSEVNVGLLNGALTLAGYLGDAALGLTVASLWRRTAADARRRILMPVLWAALRCAGDKPSALLAPILETIFLLDDSTENPSRLSERARFLSDVGFAGRHGYALPVLQYLIEIGKEDRFETIIVAILERVDHPVAIRFLTTRLAWWRERGEGGSHYATTWKENWENKHGGDPISLESLAELRLIWTDLKEPEWLRTYAFACWVELTPEIEILKEVPDLCPVDRSSVYSRARAGDRTAMKEYLAYLERDWHFLFVMPEIWSSELIPVASDWLLKMEDLADTDNGDMEHFLARLIRDIPVADGEMLLVKHWDRLRKRKAFVQAALHVSTDQTRRLAQTSIDGWRDDDDPFEHIDRYFFTGAYKMRPDDRLSLRQLEGLSPHLTRLSSQMLGELIDFSGKRGYFAFVRTSLLQEARSRYSQLDPSDQESAWLRRSMRDWAPTSQELSDELDRIAGYEELHKGFHIEIMLERFLKSDQPIELLFEALEAWLTASPDANRFAISSTLVRYWGKRKHLAILGNCSFVQNAAGQEMLGDSRYDVFKRSLE